MYYFYDIQHFVSKRFVGTLIYCHILVDNDKEPLQGVVNINYAYLSLHNVILLHVNSECFLQNCILHKLFIC